MTPMIVFSSTARELHSYIHAFIHSYRPTHSLRMSELTREQLLGYVKKQKVQIKKLDAEIASLKEAALEAGAVSPLSGISSHITPYHPMSSNIIP